MSEPSDEFHFYSLVRPVNSIPWHIPQVIFQISPSHNSGAATAEQLRECFAVPRRCETVFLRIMSPSLCRPTVSGVTIII